MGDEDGVVMVKIGIPQRGTGHMGHGIVAGQLDDGLVAGELAVDGEREALEDALLAEPGEDVGGGAALVVAALGAHMVEGTAIGHVHLEHLVEPRRRRPVFQKRQFGPLLDPHQMVQHRVGGFGAVQIDQRHRPGRLAGHPDHDAVGGGRRVQRRQRARHRRLAARLEHAVEILRPVDVTGGGLGEALDLDAGHGKVVRGLRVEHPVDEDHLQPVHLGKGHRLLRVEQGGGLGRGGVERGRVGVAPVFVAPGRQARLAQPRQRLFARPGGPAAPGGDLERGQPRLGGRPFRLCQRHHATS